MHQSPLVFVQLTNHKETGSDQICSNHEVTDHWSTVLVRLKNEFVEYVRNTLLARL